MTATVFGDGYLQAVTAGEWFQKYAVVSGTPNVGNAGALVALSADGMISPDLVHGDGVGDMLRANNLSDVISVSSARTNLGLGTAALQATGFFATAAQGTKADNALPLANLNGGTTSQVLTKNSNTNQDYSWQDAGGGGGSGIQIVTVTLTAEELATIDTIPFELVAMPGLNKVLWINQVILFDNGLITGNLTNIPNDGSILWNGSTDDTVDGNNSLLNNLMSTDNAVGNISATIGTEVYNGSSGLILSDKVNKALQFKTQNSLSITGAIATSSLDDPGIGFAIGDTFTVDGGALDPILAEGIVDSVDGLGAILTYHFTNNVGGYVFDGTNFSITATSGIGTGAILFPITADYSVNPLTLKIRTIYTVLDV